MDSQKRKILFRINTLRGGGAEKVLITILKYINYDKYEIDLLVNKKGYVYDNQVPKQVNFKFLFKASTILPKYRLLYKFIRELGLSLYNAFPQLLYKLKILGKYDIEIAFVEDQAPFVAKSDNKKSKKIAWVHIDLLELSTLSSKQKERICKSLTQYDNIIVVSNKVGENLKLLSNNFGLPIDRINSKIQTIYNPIDVDEIVLNSKKTFDPVDGVIGTIIIAIATLSIQKRLDRLIKTHKKLIDANVPNTLWILGEGPMRPQLESLITELNVKNSVTLLGFKTNPYPYLKKADVFVLSSDQEGFPLVLSEALVLEKPIVATEIAGTVEMLQNGKFGILVEPSVEGLFQGLKTILKSNRNFDSVVKKARMGKNQFNCRRSVLEIEDIFDS